MLIFLLILVWFLDPYHPELGAWVPQIRSLNTPFPARRLPALPAPVPPRLLSSPNVQGDIKANASTLKSDCSSEKSPELAPRASG